MHSSLPRTLSKNAWAARKLFRASGAFVEVAGAADITQRLDAVYPAIYLLFKEGYHGSRSEPKVRDDLCSEAIRLYISKVVTAPRSPMVLPRPRHEQLWLRKTWDRIAIRLDSNARIAGGPERGWHPKTGCDFGRYLFRTACCGRACRGSLCGLAARGLGRVLVRSRHAQGIQREDDAVQARSGVRAYLRAVRLRLRG